MARNLHPQTPKPKDELTLTFSLRKVEDGKYQGIYIVTCPEMGYSGPTDDPHKMMIGLMNEWFDLDMGRETPLLDSYERP